jgi:hypothetical protein
MPVPVIVIGAAEFWHILRHAVPRGCGMDLPTQIDAAAPAVHLSASPQLEAMRYLLPRRGGWNLSN